MKLSQVVDRVIRAIEERLEPDQAYQTTMLRGMAGQLIRQFGDLELNIIVKRIPLEEVQDGEAAEKDEK